MSSPSPSHAELAAVLTRLACAAGASDLHGSLIGYLCMGGVAQAEGLLERLESTGDHAADAAAIDVFELGDFGAIAAAHFDYADDDEEDENALAEVLEFVRVGTLLLHAELGALARADDSLH